MPAAPLLARAARIAGRALRLRCPRCGQTPLFPARPASGATRTQNSPPAIRRGLAALATNWIRAWFVMAPACPRCGLRYERAQGYFVGAIYINYGVTSTIAVGGFFLLWGWADLSAELQLALWAPFIVLFPLWFFRWSRSLWLGLEYFINPEP